MITIPWWLRPWSEVRGLRAYASRQRRDLQARIDSLHQTAGRDIKTIRDLRDELARADCEIGSLRGQLAASVTGARTSGAALSTAAPEFVLVGIPRGAGLGKRLQASRDITVTAFAMTEIDDPPPRWKIGAIMERLLVIDKPTYGEALAHLATIWSNWDRDERPVIRDRQRRAAIEGGS